MDIMKSLIFLTLTAQLASAATHSLQYFYTAVTPGISFPEFTLVGQVDGEQFMYYASDIRRMIPKTDWIKKAGVDDPDYWNSNTQLARGNQEDFKVSLAVAMERYNQTKGGGSVGLIIGAVTAVLLLVIIVCVGVFIWRKKSGFKPVSQTPSEGDSSSNNSK
ncbi:hypothetical protein MHYP_G00262330 [Metynnis hypsauchen]